MGYEFSFPADDPLLNGLMMWWTFDDFQPLQGGPVPDSSGNGISGKVAWSSTRSPAPYSGIVQDEEGRSGSFRYFGNSSTFNQNIQFTCSQAQLAALCLPTATSTRSYSWWVMKDPAASVGGQFIAWRNSGNGNSAFDLGAGGTLSVRGDNAVGGYVTLNPTNLTPVGNGAWHHIALTINAAKLVTFYLDGQPNGTGTHPVTNSVTPNLASAYFGYISASPFAGYIFDDWRVYNRTLSPAEIYEMYARVVTQEPEGDRGVMMAAASAAAEARVMVMA